MPELRAYDAHRRDPPGGGHRKVGPLGYFADMETPTHVQAQAVMPGETFDKTKI
jgi:hypothetical protein